MSPTRPRLAACAIAVSLAAPPALARAQGRGSGWTFHLSPQVAYFRGETKYRIAVTDGVSSVASELEFPIETGGIGLHARLAQVRERGRGGAVFEAGAFFSVGARTGTMKDSDWLSGPAETAPPPDGVGAPHDGKDIYSETKADLSARMIDVRAAWEFDALAPGVALAAMAGVFHQRFEFDVHDGTQWGYGPWDATASRTIEGPALTYLVSYLVPYLGGRASLTQGPFRGEAELWVSPLADASDEDDHLLRQKLSKTEASGNAWSGSIGAGLALGPRDAVKAQASIVRIRAEGTQVQRFYDGSNVMFRIPSTITSSRAAFLLTYSHAL